MTTCDNDNKNICNLKNAHLRAFFKFISILFRVNFLEVKWVL